MKSSTSSRAFVGVFVLAASLWTLTLSVTPQLHQRVHHDANRFDHCCAVTFVSSGNINHTPVGLLIKAPIHTDEFKIPELTALWIQPLFLLASVFEHAPPAKS